MILLDPVVANEVFDGTNQNKLVLFSIISLILLIGIFLTIRNIRNKNNSDHT